MDLLEKEKAAENLQPPRMWNQDGYASNMKKDQPQNMYGV